MIASDLLSQAYLEAQRSAITAFADAEKVVEVGKSFREIAEGVCHAIASQDLYICVYVGLLTTEFNKSLQMVAVDGEAKGYGKSLSLSWDPNSVYGSGPTGIALRSGEPVVMSDTEMASNFGPWVSNARLFGIRSSLSVPLVADGKNIGILIVYSKEPSSFGPSEIFIFKKLAKKLAGAVNL
ncbi:GAF domain-containing protein [Polynucleobacter necessarius]|uniref:GAF domain-containing protein n=1 Tax=Polynucleobacter necessarius TaxID=576610 RepID=UPI0013B0512C|nr:GAF domain-containing protein [Polynucleobacter necessarius]